MNIKSTNMVGFTLVELMVVVAIIGLLGAVAYPAYMDSVRTSRRNDGQAALLDAAQRLETYYARHSTYSTNLTDSNISDTSERGFYNNLSITPCGSGIASCYILEIDPTGEQVADTVDGYRLYSSGRKERNEGGWIDDW